MDWLQFIASLVGSLAWPIAAVAIAVIFHKQLVALLRRLAEMTLPGGAKFVFREALEESREAIDEIEEKPRRLTYTRDHSVLEFKNSTSEGFDVVAQMLSAYNAVEELFADVAAANGLTGTHWAVWKALQKRGAISDAAATAMDKLRKARNALVHVSPQVEAMEALEFVRQAMVLQEYLKGLLEKPPPKQG
jgi:uncharacterized protein YutE (UPF0331/DUF86 family)